MSGLPELPHTAPLAGPTPEDARIARAIADARTDVAVILGWFLAAALVGAVLWWQVTPLPVYTRTDGGGAMDAQQLAKQVSADGWFFVIAAIGGLVSGVVLTLWRRRDPIVTVGLIALGGILATWVMLVVGKALGPEDPGVAFAGVPVGGTVPTQLGLESKGLWAVWAIAALLGALGVLFGTEQRDARAAHDAADGASPSF